jgi:hypothetical protein
MKSRQKRKNHHSGHDLETRKQMLERTLCHLNRSVRQFVEGLQSRGEILQKRLILEPLEGAAWSGSHTVRKIQARVFDFIDERIAKLEDARHRKIEHQTELERFDDEGGAMQPTLATPHDSFEYQSSIKNHSESLPH